ncbi:MAG TPA: hypothetical protein VFO65_09070 [Acidimicrobiales bacterium]|nr:hypothetical protein [Acidimicrobiales bacterium]
MLKRNFAVVLVAGLVLGGAAVALAGDGPARPTVLAAAQAETQPPGPGGEEPADRQARREALRSCLEAAGEDEAARRACFEAAGPGPARHARRHGPRPGAPFGPALLGRAVHGTVTVPAPEGGGWQEVTFDRGKVDEATDGSKVVLDRADGETVTIGLTADTKYHGVENAEALVDGRPALVVSKDGKATHVLQMDPERRRPGNKADAPGVGSD